MIKTKDIIWVIVLNSFLGYLYVVFGSHLADVLNSIESISSTLTLLIAIAGTAMFFIVVRRANPKFDVKVNHPINILKFVSFVGAMFWYGGVW